MRTFTVSMRLVAFTFTAGLLVMPAPADAGQCKKVHAEIVADPIFGCASSPIGLCTVGVIAGNHGLKGATFFTGDSMAAGPATAPNPEWTISYSGSLVVSTPRGALTIRDNGLFDQLTGLFSSFAVVDPLNSSGDYAGATGTLFIGGKFVDGQFVTTMIEGELCRP